MSEVARPAAQHLTQDNLQEIRTSLRRLERRDWWLWASAILVMFLLAGALVTFSLPGVFAEEDLPFRLNLELAVRGLAALVLLFSTYAIYQQVLIKRLRDQLAKQLDAMVELQMRAEQFHQLATFDSLTGLYNRRVAEQTLAVEISRSTRNDYPLTALALDLDGLKQINDRYGHAAGDLALKAFAARLKKAVRSSDLPARVGGDEFLVLLPECHPELVPRVLARLSGLELEINGRKVPVVFSAGWAGYQPGERADQLLSRADQALYDNKRTGKVEDEVRQAQEQIRQAQKMEAVGGLVGGVAHDFNNLLMLIKGYSDLVLDRLKKDDPLRRHIREIRKASERATSLTRQILSFGRRQVLEPKPLDLNALLADMEMMLSRLVGEHIELVTEPGRALGKVRADPGQMEQIILTLVANARNAIPEGGTLTIKTANEKLDDAYVRQHPGARAGSYVTVAVSDTGPGLDAEARAGVFEPTSLRSRQSQDAGLATVYGIVKQSGGYIAVESQPGQGTTFRVYLPQIEGTEAELESHQAIARVSEGSETILVVEDEEPLRKLTCEFLENGGYQVLEARDGDDALHVCDQHEGPIHLVVTDVVMPKMNGWELAKHLAIRRPETRVLYVSGHSDDAVIRHGLLDPEVSFLRKPFTLDTLSRKLRQVLATEPKA